MRDWQIRVTAGVFAALMLISGSVPGPAEGAAPEAVASKDAGSLPNDVATLLDDCKDDEITGIERQSLCSELIGNTQLPPAVRAEALVNRGIRVVAFSNGRMEFKAVRCPVYLRFRLASASRH